MIYYLCTSKVVFAPLTSRGVPDQRARSASERIMGLPPKPSAKSIYRVADKVSPANKYIYYVSV